ncbi:MAG: hypothetical protein COV74_06710 [Candidatus Omnitrophica bacterium CG11_big_fil_rev_8_21_14_0_20_45_26]|uniref:Uncharacterized protein n=1 Tax=Candidatus Abzuiibacterium crystallinum TaxID=1974748 RepID=A0A2H0LND6_9BACT|nr:MAG: hypothetical protein COV74_06710 [Candidatus Omnitrophica bacterium CG11_big_fil_rev_8_21_14_0_20_45_26]
MRKNAVIGFLLIGFVFSFVFIESVTPALAKEPQSTHQDGTFPNGKLGKTFTHFIFDLYNGLIRQGYLNEPLLEYPHQIWSREFESIQNALALYDAERGGYVTHQHLYLPDQTATVTVEANDQLFLNLTAPPAHLLLGERRGILDFELDPVGPNEPDLAQKIGHNVQRLYAQYLRDLYRGLNDPDILFNYDFINTSGVEAYLKNYLNGLVNSGLVESYHVDMDEASVGIKVFQGAGGLPFNAVIITGDLVNTFTANEEANVLAALYNDVIKDSFVYINPELQHDKFIFLRANLLVALQAVVDLGIEASPSKKRRAFLAMYGLGDRLVSTSQRDGGDIEYPAGIVTPANDKVAYVQGVDWNGAFAHGSGFFPLTNAFPQYGYTVESHVYPFDDFPAALQALKKAQTIIFDVHGKSGGGLTLQCYPDVPFGVECCYKTKEAAAELGIDVSAMDCDNWPDYIIGYYDPTHSVIGLSTGDKTCPGGGETDRCHIDLGTAIYDNLGTKAAVITSQCYGGACSGSFGHVTNVMDYYSEGPGEINWTSISRYDVNILSEDVINHHRKHLDCLFDELTGDETTPSCRKPPEDMVYGLWRTIQHSVYLRKVSGKVDRNASFVYCEPAYTFQWPDLSGIKQYCAAHVAGEELTSVEFAPTFNQVIYTPQDGIFTAYTTSEIKDGVGNIEVDDSACPTRLSNDGDYDTALRSGSASVSLSGYPLASEAFWEKDPDELQARYGQDQSNWPWLIKIKVSGAEAPNGIALDGNDDAYRKWVWTLPGKGAAPWRDVMGRQPAGDDAEFWLPCVPPIACCYPNLEPEPTNGGEDCIYVQNGCTCGSASSMGTDPDSDPYARCYVRAPHEDNDHPECLNSGEVFPGEPHLVHECCNGDVCEAYTIKEKPCPQTNGRPNENTKKWKTYHYREWSMDLNENKNCEPIVEECPGIFG